MSQLGIAVDGGKDSLSMAARVGGELVKSPGTLVVSTYAPCTDIRHVIHAALKQQPKETHLLHVRFGTDFSACRLGGSALAQVCLTVRKCTLSLVPFFQAFNQLADQTPDIDQPTQFVRAFQVTQQLIKDEVLLSGHDISDGGLVTTALEMAFAGLEMRLVFC